MLMLLKHAGDRERTLGGCHLGDMEWIDYVEVELDRLRAWWESRVATQARGGALLVRPAERRRSGTSSVREPGSPERLLGLGYPS
jgi:hypothetical protein